MGLSTTFNRLPSTIPKSEISKLLVDSLSSFRNYCDGRPLWVKRSRWAAFVAQHQTGHFETGLFDHICQPIARAIKKAPSQISFPGLQWVRKSHKTVRISPQLRRGAGRHRFPHLVHLRKWLWHQMEPEPLKLSYGAGDGNRTRVISLEGWGSTIELRPQDMVGTTGFEPATSCSQSRRATKLRHVPKVLSS